MTHELKLRQLIPALLLPLAVGAAAGFLTKEGMMMYALMAKPPLSPPAWLFPVVWTALYIMMGLASALVWSAGVSVSRRDRALSAYALSLVANFVWPFLFFWLELYNVAFFWLLMLWGMVAVCTLLFWYIRKSAGMLMLPYVAWLGFAAYLNLGVWILNR